jgi:hypothetical protein
VTRVRGTRGTLVVALAALLVLAGCSAIGGLNGDAETSLTPVAVPGEAPENRLAPGLGERRVYAVGAVERAHRRALANRSFTLYRTQTIYPAGSAPTVRDAEAPTTRTPTATPANESATATTSAGPRLGANGTYDRVVVRATVVGQRRYTVSRIETSAPAYPGAERFGRLDLWFDRGVSRNRLVNAQGVVRYWGQNLSNDEGPVADPTRSSFVAADLVAFRYRATERRDDGETRYRLVGTGLRTDRLDTPPQVSDPHAGRLYAVVDPNGLVRRYRLSYDATFDGRPVRVVKTHRIVPAEGTALPQPHWLPAADQSVQRGYRVLRNRGVSITPTPTPTGDDSRGGR